MVEQRRYDIWAYASATSITTTGNLTGTYWPGMRVALKQTTIKYFVIESVTYNSPNTTIVLDGLGVYTVANAAITAHIDWAEFPKGFPYPNLANQIKSAIKAYCDTLYALRSGLAGGQTIIGDTASGGNLTLQSTSHATRGYVKIADACEFLSYSNFLRADGALFGIGAYHSGGWKRTTANQAGAVIRNTSGRMEIWTGAAETAAADTTITGFSKKVTFWPEGGMSVGSETAPGAGNLLATMHHGVQQSNTPGTGFLRGAPTDYPTVSGWTFRVAATGYDLCIDRENAGWVQSVIFTRSNGNVRFEADVSVGSITDRTPAYTGDALAEIKKISHTAKGEIDHSSLPPFIQAEGRDKNGKKTIERDLGGSISMLFKAVQELMAENELLKARVKVLEDVI